MRALVRRLVLGLRNAMRAEFCGGDDVVCVRRWRVGHGQGRLGRGQGRAVYRKTWLINQYYHVHTSRHDIAIT